MWDKFSLTMDRILLEQSKSYNCIEWDGRHQDPRVSSEQQCRLDQMEEKPTSSKPHVWYMGMTDSFSQRCTSIIVANTWWWCLDEESLQTPMTETEAVISSRPLTVEAINEDFKLLSPNNLLPTKSKVVMLPPGVFQIPDLYCRKRWRRVPHVMNDFWCRWSREFVHTLQERQRWTKIKWNFRINDIALLKEDAPRNQSPLCKIYFLASETLFW